MFGCKAFVHVLKEQRLKLDDKDIPCIFVKYEDQEFSYKLWDPEKRNIIKSRDVVFYEDKFGDDNQIKKGQKENGMISHKITISSPLDHVTNGEDVTPEEANDEVKQQQQGE